MKKYCLYLLTIVILAINQLLSALSQKLNFLINNNFISINQNPIFGFSKNYDLFLIICIIVISFLSILTVTQSYRQKIVLAVMLGGGINILFDRIIYGGVVDYLKITINNHTWRFNLADILLLFGLFIYLYLTGKENEKNHNKILGHK